MKDSVRVGDVVRLRDGLFQYEPHLVPGKDFSIVEVQRGGIRFRLDRCASGNRNCHCTTEWWLLTDEIEVVERITTEEAKNAARLGSAKDIPLSFFGVDDET